MWGNPHKESYIVVVKGDGLLKKNKNSDRVYKGQIKNGLPHGKGETIVWKNRLKMYGEFKRGKPWNTNLFNSKGKKSWSVVKWCKTVKTNPIIPCE